MAAGFELRHFGIGSAERHGNEKHTILAGFNAAGNYSPPTGRQYATQANSAAYWRPC